jgi:hypothetical protein
VDANIFTKQAGNLKNVHGQKDDGSCYLGGERSADGEMYATRGCTYVRNVLKTLESCIESSKTKAWNANIQCSAPP